MVSLGCWYHLWISNNDPLRAWWSHYMTTNSTNQKRKHQNNVNYGHYPYHNIIIMKIINFVFLTKYVPKIRTKRSAIDALVVIMIMIDPLNLCIMTCFCCGPWANNFVVRPTFWHRLVWLWILLRSLLVYLNVPAFCTLIWFWSIDYWAIWLVMPTVTLRYLVCFFVRCCFSTFCLLL